MIGLWNETGVPLEGKGDGSMGCANCTAGWITMGRPMAPGILMGGGAAKGEAAKGTVPIMGGGCTITGSGDGPCNWPGGGMTGVTGPGVPTMMIFWGAGG